MEKKQTGTPPDNGADQETEAYLYRQAEEMAEIFGHEFGDNPVEKLDFMHRVTDNMKELFTQVELPWSSILPVIVDGILLRYERTEGRDARKKLRWYIQEVIKCGLYMVESGGHRKKISVYTEQRLNEIGRLIEAKKGNADGGKDG